MSKAENRDHGSGIRAGIRSLAAQLRSWLRVLAHRNRLEAEMETELAFHLEQLAADLIRAGQSSTEAARNARVALGPTLLHKEDMRASLGLRLLDELRSDLRYATRMVRRSPGFSMIAVSSLALAIGANTAIFSVAKQILYARLDVPHAEQLRMLRWNGDGKEAVHSMWGDFDSSPNGTTSSVFSYPVYKQLRDRNQSLQTLIAFKEDSMNATVRGAAQRVVVSMVSGNFYEGLGVRPQLGRVIYPSDDNLSASGAVALISDAIWERDFNRSPSVLGQIFTLNQTAVTIVGVNPAGFTGAKNVQQSPDIFIPLCMQPLVDPKGQEGDLLNSSSLWWVNVVGRTRLDVTESQAQAALSVQLDAAVRATMSIESGDSMPRLALVDGSRGLHYTDQIFKKPIDVLMALTGLVLLLACANIANLILARGAARKREISVRLAMGAGRARILRQLLTESLLLSVLGGVVGLGMGYLGRNLIPDLMSNSWEQGQLNMPFDWGVFGFAATVTLLTGVLFGIAPAWTGAHFEMSNSLKETAQTTTRRHKGLSGRLLVAFQIALSTLLVVVAGLFLRSLYALNHVDVGFKADNLLLFEVNPPASRYRAGEDVRLHGRLEQKFAALPGVESVAPAWQAYITEGGSNGDFLPEGEAFDPASARGSSPIQLA